MQKSWRGPRLQGRLSFQCRHRLLLSLVFTLGCKEGGEHKSGGGAGLKLIGK